MHTCMCTTCMCKCAGMRALEPRGPEMEPLEDLLPHECLCEVGGRRDVCKHGECMWVSRRACL